MGAVEIWWVILSVLSFLNIFLWILLKEKTYGNARSIMLWLCFIYVVVCAYRSVLPRADVQRMMLFDSWISSVFFGRLAATVAELAFVAQWFLLLKKLGEISGEKFIVSSSRLIVPAIFIAEACSWYGVTFEYNLAHAIEESIWGLVFILVSFSCLKLAMVMKKKIRFVLLLLCIGSAFYVFYMFLVDVPMYFNRFLADSDAKKIYPTFMKAIKSLMFERMISWDYRLWKDEIPWMTGYFTIAVYSSLGITYFYKKLESKEITE